MVAMPNSRKLVGAFESGSDAPAPVFGDSRSVTSSALRMRLRTRCTVSASGDGVAVSQSQPEKEAKAKDSRSLLVQSLPQVSTRVVIRLLCGTKAHRPSGSAKGGWALNMW